MSDTHKIDAIIRLFVHEPVLIHVVTEMKVSHPVEVGVMLMEAESAVKQAIIDAVVHHQFEFRNLKISEKQYFHDGEGYYEKVSDPD